MLIVASKRLFDDLGLEFCPTRQAVSKARTNLEPEYIRRLVHDHAKIACLCDDSGLFADKFRLCAIDGSGISVNSALRENFSTHAGAATSLAYDPLNGIILDGTLHLYATDECTAAKANITAIKQFVRN